MTSLNELAGLFGYAFSDVRPQFTRNRETLTMDVSFRVAETPRVYVERIDIQGNTADPRRGDPPRVPARRGRRLQQYPRPPLARPHPVARLLPGQSGNPSGAGLRAGSRRARGRRRRSGRPASCSSRPASRASSASSSACRSGSAISAAAARSCAPGSIGRPIRARPSWASPSPICSTATSRSASTCSGAIITASTSSATGATTTYQQVTTGGQIRAGVPLTENISLALRYGLTYDEIGLSQDALFSPIRTVTGRFRRLAIRWSPVVICAIRSATG